ncbi:hypothetical protein Taro_044336 [Colocasia esculenta]|uniref:Uncharacterized protein n=1 Tax=Colocasia esculenta TaxID=4460 RepID=A0A843WY23_COLES|nr:hypothetical protein [Colocasia esculenta]
MLEQNRYQTNTCFLSHLNHLRAKLKPDEPPLRIYLDRTIHINLNSAAAAAAGNRRSGPTTPLLRWKFEDAELSGKPKSKPASKSEHGGAKASGSRAAGAVAAAGGGAVSGPVSARKLAAGIWQLQLPEFSVPVKSIAARPVHGHIQSPHLCKLTNTDLHRGPIDGLASPIPVPNLSNGASSKVDHSAALPYSAMERATKWDPGFSKASDEVFRFYSHLKLLEDQQVTTVSVVSALQAELEGARSRVNELEDERRTMKKKLDHFLKKVAEEKASWRTREHEKVRAVIDDMKDALSREKKNRQRMEIVNSKLVNELAEAKLTAKRCSQDCEKERKARELVEEVCDELAKEIGEDKAEVEALRRESMKIREEVDEERKMLQMAEVWREERVQMKLIDAKLTLEEKYSQLSKLQSDLEAFLQARNSSSSDVADIKEAELLRDAANSVKVEEVKEFVYQPPPASEDIFSVFEELHPGVETNERGIEPCYGYSPASRASKIHTVSPEMNGYMEKPVTVCANGTMYTNVDMEDDSGWETISQAEEQGSSNSPDGSDPSVNGICESNASVSGTDWEENGNADSEISEVFSGTTRQSRKKIPSIARLWRSSSPNNSEKCKLASAEIANERLSNGRISNGTLSPDIDLGEAGLSPMHMGQWRSPDSVNATVMRGMKGCIEWPRGMQKHSLKAKLLEARMESQKIQLRQVLKQKI